LTATGAGAPAGPCSSGFERGIRTCKDQGEFVVTHNGPATGVKSISRRTCGNGCGGHPAAFDGGWSSSLAACRSRWTSGVDMLCRLAKAHGWRHGHGDLLWRQPKGATIWEGAQTARQRFFDFRDMMAANAKGGSLIRRRWHDYGLRESLKKMLFEEGWTNVYARHTAAGGVRGRDAAWGLRFWWRSSPDLLISHTVSRRIYGAQGSSTVTP